MPLNLRRSIAKINCGQLTASVVVTVAAARFTPVRILAQSVSPVTKINEGAATADQSQRALNGSKTHSRRKA